jgi:hypothetical protein
VREKGKMREMGEMRKKEKMGEKPTPNPSQEGNCREEKTTNH